MNGLWKAVHSLNEFSDTHIITGIMMRRKLRVYQMMPWPIMALATFMKPAMLAPFM